MISEIQAQQNDYNKECHSEIAFEQAFKKELFTFEQSKNYMFLSESLKGFWFKNRITRKIILLEDNDTPSKYYRK